jgi:hypothetical protein
MLPRASWPYFGFWIKGMRPGTIVCAMFQIEDEFHAEPSGEFVTLHEAISELLARAKLPWDEPPNRAPCRSWRTCGRRYVVVEYDDSRVPWRKLRTIPAVNVGADGVRWADGPS